MITNVVSQGEMFRSVRTPTSDRIKIMCGGCSPLLLERGWGGGGKRK